MASVAAKDSTASLTTPAPASSQVPAAGPSRVHRIGTIDELEQFFAGSMGKPLLIEFFAEWCGPCKLIAAKLEEWVKIYEVTIVKIDVDELEDVAIDYNVAGIPTFALIKDKQKVEQLEGSSEERIIEALEKYCEKSSEYSKTVTGLLTSQEANVNRTLPITENTSNGPSSQLNQKGADN